MNGNVIYNRDKVKKFSEEIMDYSINGDATINSTYNK